jgi:hypothetical protein
MYHRKENQNKRYRPWFQPISVYSETIPIKGNDSSEFTARDSIKGGIDSEMLSGMGVTFSTYN